MIQCVSQSISKYPAFKNIPKDKPKDNYCAIGGKAAREINTDLDYRRKVVEQNERLIGICGITALTLLLGGFIFNIRQLVELTKGKADNKMPAVIRKFESLKDNPQVPALQDCKSVNKDLKSILENHINRLKAGQDLIEETGEPKASNRLLLYGPPGVGKSFFGRIFAKSIDAEYMEVMHSDINSVWVGEGVDNIRNVFKNIEDTAKKHPNQKYVVVFNEIDAMVGPIDKITQSKGSHWISVLEERSAFLNSLEILKERTPNVTIIGTTNISPKNNGLDRAAMSRFQNLVEVPYPDKDCLYEALKMNLNKIKNKDKLIKENDEKLKDLAQKMADRKFSFRNLEYIVNEAKAYHLNDRMNGNNNDFKFEYLQKAQEAFKLSDGELEAAAKS